MAETVKCRYCKGTGLARLWVDERRRNPCYACKGTKVQPTPKKKLQSLIDPDAFLVALDHAEDAGFDLSLKPDAVNVQENCAYLVGATEIIQTLVKTKRLPYVVIRVDTQHNADCKNAYYYRPVFRKDVLVHCLIFLLGKSEEEVERHLRCLDKRYETEGRWMNDEGRRGPRQRRKRWTMWSRKVPTGCSLT